MKTLGIVFSNLHDKDVPELTAHRTLASIPFGGRYRLVDFVLSSMVNCGVEKVGIITKSNYRSLMDHVGSGKSWDLARKNGGLIVLPPYGAGETDTLYNNRLEAIIGVMSFIKHCKEEYVIMSDCDNVANVNYDEVMEQHIAKRADITMVYRTARYSPKTTVRGILDVEKDGRIKKFTHTADISGEAAVYTNMMVLSRATLINILEAAIRDNLKSFSRDILTNQTGRLRIFGYKFDGYFASINSIQSYFKHNMELLNPFNLKSLFTKDSPVYTKNRDSAPVVVAETASISNSLIADGCRIEGKVSGSVLFRGVHVAKNAVVTNSIIMQDSIISQNASVNCIIADKNVLIKEKKTLSGCEELPYYISKGTML